METQLSAPLAPIGRRLLALILDGLVLAIPCAVASHVLPFAGGVVVWALYAPALESSPLQATLGKIWLDMRVVGLNGSRISFKTALIRNLAKIFSGALVGVGYLMALFSSRRQSLHDLVADTLVVNGVNRAPVFDTWVESIRELFNSEFKSATHSTESAVTQLERLQALREKGALSEEEFLAQKRKILGDI